VIDQAAPMVQVASATSDTLIAEVGRLIFEDREYAPDDWAVAAVVFNFVNGRRNSFGYVFKSDGSWEARLPDSWDSIDKMLELQAAMERQTGKKWHRALIHITRETTAMNVQFEYDDPTRWQIVPSKLDESVNALRP
jgi:hypothetical protein